MGIYAVYPDFDVIYKDDDNRQPVFVRGSEYHAPTEEKLVKWITDIMNYEIKLDEAVIKSSTDRIERRQATINKLKARKEEWSRQSLVETSSIY